jgi:hypothetical protein
VSDDEADEFSIPGEDGYPEIDLWIDADGYVVFTDKENDYELALSAFNWKAVVAWVDMQRRKEMS